VYWVFRARSPAICSSNVIFHGIRPIKFLTSVIGALPPFSFQFIMLRYVVHKFMTSPAVSPLLKMER
jgi:hypothetical protein